VFAEIAVVVRAAAAFSFLANTTVLALRFAFLDVEAACLLDDHVSALHNSSHIRIHLELKNNEVWSVLRRNHLFWKFNLNCLVSDFSAAWEEITLHAHWSDWHVSLAIVADFDSAVAFLGDSLGSPLDVVLGSLGS